METELLVAVAVILPLLGGLICLMLSARRLRGWTVSLVALMLGANSLFMLYCGDSGFTPMGVFETAVLALDFLLLGYFLYIGIKTKNHLISVQDTYSPRRSSCLNPLLHKNRYSH